MYSSLQEGHMLLVKWSRIFTILQNSKLKCISYLWYSWYYRLACRARCRSGAPLVRIRTNFQRCTPYLLLLSYCPARFGSFISYREWMNKWIYLTLFHQFLSSCDSNLTSIYLKLIMNISKLDGKQRTLSDNWNRSVHIEQYFIILSNPKPQNHWTFLS